MVVSLVGIFVSSLTLCFREKDITIDIKKVGA